MARRTTIAARGGISAAARVMRGSHHLALPRGTF
jgi:hypothetical protein